MVLIEPKVLSKNDIHKYIVQFGVTAEIAIVEMHELIDEYKKYQESLRKKKNECDAD
jgi:hypothetical protein